MAKKIKKIKLQEPIIPPNQYPFLNPIIITDDKKILDGQTRYEVCKERNMPINYVNLGYHSNDVENPECLKLLREIQESQRLVLESYFKKYDIGYEKQLLWSSSEDRFKKFYDFKEIFIKKGKYWELLFCNYQKCNNTFKFRKELKEVFSANVPDREKYLTEEARAFINAAPDLLTIYRGMSVAEYESRDYGISWSIDKKVAEKFAHNYYHNYDTHGQEHVIKELVIKKTQIINYYHERNEKEVIYIHNLTD